MKSSCSGRIIRSAAVGAVPYSLESGYELRPGFAAFESHGPLRPVPPRGGLQAAVDEAFARGRAEGLRQGLAEGRAEAEGELEGLKATIEMAVREVWAHRERLVAEVEEDVTRLALAVAAKVVGETAVQDPQVLERLVEAALRRVAVRDRITLRVNPEDVVVVRTQREHWLSLVEGVEHFEVVEDRRVPRGGALVTTLDGSVDARWTTQLKEIERGLLGDPEKK